MGRFVISGFTLGLDGPLEGVTAHCSGGLSIEHEQEVGSSLVSKGSIDLELGRWIGDRMLTLKEFNFLISANVFGGLALASHVPFAYWSAVQ
jgi:hypothetical protein